MTKVVKNKPVSRRRQSRQLEKCNQLFSDQTQYRIRPVSIGPRSYPDSRVTEPDNDQDYRGELLAMKLARPRPLCHHILGEGQINGKETTILENFFASASRWDKYGYGKTGEALLPNPHKVWNCI